MEAQVSKKQSNKEMDYERYVIHRNLEDYWRAEEKVQLVLTGLTGHIPVTELCKLNGVTPSQYYEWREKFLASGKQGLMVNGGRSVREADLEKKVRVLERCIGELTLEKELLKKLQD